MGGGVSGWKWIDVPPVWTALHLIALWLWRDAGPRVEARGLDWAGGALIALGLLLMLWAVAAMWRARTTVIPHGAPDALVTDGPFAWSRNPIYLGDVLVVAGAVLIAGTVWGVALPPLLALVLGRRFIAAEEARLDAAFGDDFARWARRVRRWI